MAIQKISDLVPSEVYYVVFGKKDTAKKMRLIAAVNDPHFYRDTQLLLWNNNNSTGCYLFACEIGIGMTPSEARKNYAKMKHGEHPLFKLSKDEANYELDAFILQ